jgi:hypothetical protein
LPRCRESIQSRSGKPNSYSLRAPTASNGAPTAATPFSTTIPGSRRPSRRCAAGWRRNSLWKRPSCAWAASPASLPAPCRRSAMCA